MDLDSSLSTAEPHEEKELEKSTQHDFLESFSKSMEFLGSLFGRKKSLDRSRSSEVLTYKSVMIVDYHTEEDEEEFVNIEIVPQSEFPEVDDDISSQSDFEDSFFNQSDNEEHSIEPTNLKNATDVASKLDDDTDDESVHYKPPEQEFNSQELSETNETVLIELVKTENSDVSIIEEYEVSKLDEDSVDTRENNDEKSNTSEVKADIQQSGDNKEGNTNVECNSFESKIEDEHVNAKFVVPDEESNASFESSSASESSNDSEIATQVIRTDPSESLADKLEALNSLFDSSELPIAASQQDIPSESGQNYAEIDPNVDDSTDASSFCSSIEHNEPQLSIDNELVAPTFSVTATSNDHILRIKEEQGDFDDTQHIDDVVISDLPLDTEENEIQISHIQNLQTSPHDVANVIEVSSEMDNKVSKDQTNVDNEDKIDENLVNALPETVEINCDVSLDLNSAAGSSSIHDEGLYDSNSVTIPDNENMDEDTEEKLPHLEHINPTNHSSENVDFTQVELNHDIEKAEFGKPEAHGHSASSELDQQKNGGFFVIVSDEGEGEGEDSENDGGDESENESEDSTTAGLIQEDLPYEVTSNSIVKNAADKNDIIPVVSADVSELAPCVKVDGEGPDENKQEMTVADDYIVIESRPTQTLQKNNLNERQVSSSNSSPVLLHHQKDTPILDTPILDAAMMHDDVKSSIIGNERENSNFVANIAPENDNCSISIEPENDEIDVSENDQPKLGEKDISHSDDSNTSEVSVPSENVVTSTEPDTSAVTDHISAPTEDVEEPVVDDTLNDVHLTKQTPNSEEKEIDSTGEKNIADLKVQRVMDEEESTDLKFSYENAATEGSDTPEPRRVPLSDNDNNNKSPIKNQSDEKLKRKKKKKKRKNPFSVFCGCGRSKVDP